MFDMAVPRDFDPRLHDGDRVSVFNVDDLQRTADQWAAERRKHIPAAEAIVAGEVTKFVHDWNRRKDGPVIGQLTAEVDKVRENDCDAAPGEDEWQADGCGQEAYIEGAFRLFSKKNKLFARPNRGAAGSEPHRPHRPAGSPDEAVWVEGARGIGEDKLFKECRCEIAVRMLMEE